MSSRNGLGAFLVGGLIGAAVALLYAPKSGTETREDLKERSRLVRDRAMDSLDEAQARMENFTEQSKDRLSKLRDIGEDTFNEQKRSLRSGVKQAKRVVAGDDEDTTAG